MMKKCIKCNQIKNEIDFPKGKSKKDGSETRRSKCRSCYNKENCDKIDNKIGPKLCNTCKTVKLPEEFSKRNLRCKICQSNYQKKYYNEKGKFKSNEYYIKTKSKRNEISKQKRFSDEKFFIRESCIACKKRAKKSSKDYDLDFNFLFDLYQKQDKKCALTKINFSLDENPNYKCRPFGPSIDRIDSSKGYTKDNVRFVCTMVNLALNEYGTILFDKMCKAYVKNN